MGQNTNQGPDVTPPALPPDSLLELSPDSGLSTLVDVVLPRSARHSSTTHLPPVVQDPNALRMERMLAREHLVYGIPTPHVGRRKELERVYETVRDCVNSDQWKTIIIEGQTGVGKTRLVAELFGIIEPTRRGIDVLAVSASDSEPEEGLGIIAQLLRRRFNIRPSDDDDAAYEKLLHGLEPIVDRRLHSTAARLLAYLAGLRAAVVKTGEDRLDNLARFHRRAVATLCNLLQYDAAQRPSVLVVHRAQHLTERAVEVFAAAFRELKGSPITLVLLTTIKPPKALRPRSKRVVSVKLEPLDNAAMEQLARALLNRLPKIPEHMVSELIERSTGNPQLMEDNFRLLIERGFIEAAAEGPWRLSDTRYRSEPPPIPGTAEQVSAARVDALDPKIRHVLQLASVIGPTFWSSAVVALERVSRHGQGAKHDRSPPWLSDPVAEHVNESLALALAGDLLLEAPTSTVGGARQLTFASRETCQNLYEGLEDPLRKQLHRAAAHWYAGVDETHARRSPVWPEAVANHLVAGGRVERAAEFFLRAGQAAARVSATSKASELFRHGVAAIQLERPALLVALLEGLGDTEFRAGQLVAARRTFGTLLEATVLAGDRLSGSRAWLSLGRVHRSLGDFERATPCLKQALKMSRELDDTSGIADGLDELARVVWIRGGKGSYEAALDNFRRALEIRRMLGHPSGVAQSLTNISNIRLLRGQFHDALDGYREAMALRRRVGDRAGEAATFVGLGAVYFAIGDYDNAAKHWTNGLALVEALGHRVLAGIFLNNLGEARLRQGRIDEAEPLLNEAGEVAEDTGEQHALADIERNRAVLAASRGDWKLALKRAKAAVELARGIQAKSSLAVALVTLGDLLSQAARLSDDTKSKSQATHAETAFHQAERLFDAAGDVVGKLRALDASAAHAKRWDDADKAKRLRKRVNRVRETCQMIATDKTSGAGAPDRPRRTTRPKLAAATPPPLSLPAPDQQSSVPPLPDLPVDTASRAEPQPTLDFGGGDLQRAALEGVGPPQVASTKKEHPRRTGPLSRHRTTKLGHLLAPRASEDGSEHSES